MDAASAQFEPERGRLTRLAYRMLGSQSEAEDAVQDTYLRWHRAERGAVRQPAAWLTTACVRICIDRLRAAKAEREAYTGPWLPEPLVLDATTPADLADQLSIGLMLVLERLTPPERAAYVLHEAFDYDHDEIARALGRSQTACRQLLSRARRHVRDNRPRFAADRARAEELARRFSLAVASGQVGAFADILAADAKLISDGGGKALAALNVIDGADRVARFLIGVNRKQPAGWRAVAAEINGAPGTIGYVDGKPYFALSLEIAGGLVRAVHIVRNPDKLGHLPPLV
jgi:RNA polymerase sigma-70 factor (ECF subfamily)